MSNYDHYDTLKILEQIKRFTYFYDDSETVSEILLNCNWADDTDEHQGAIAVNIVK